MKSNLKFILLAPFFMAILCESDDYECSLEQREAYIVNVENIADSFLKIAIPPGVSIKLS